METMEPRGWTICEARKAAVFLRKRLHLEPGPLMEDPRLILGAGFPPVKAGALTEAMEARHADYEAGAVSLEEVVRREYGPAAWRGILEYTGAGEGAHNEEG